MKTADEVIDELFKINGIKKEWQADVRLGIRSMIETILSIVYEQPQRSIDQMDKANEFQGILNERK